MLLLKRHLVELVRAGVKRQTIRFWSGAFLRAGGITYTPGLGKVRITAVEELPSYDALSEADAVADGFATRAALLAELRKIYGDGFPPGKKLFRVKFEWPVEEPPASAAPDATNKTPMPVEKHPPTIIAATPERAVDAAASVQRDIDATVPVPAAVSEPAPAAAPEAASESAVPPASGKMRSMTRAQRQQMRDFLLGQRERAEGDAAAMHDQ